MRTVMICTPAHSGSVCVHYADSLAGSIKLASAAGVDLLPVYWPGEALVHHARNMLAKIAVDARVDDVIWIDADQGWPPDAILRLLARPVDVVGCASPKKSDGEAYAVHSEHIVIDHTTGLMVVDGLGTGFLRVSRRALLAVWEASEPYTDKGNETREVFRDCIVNGQLVGEDVIFCRKLERAGHRVHLDTSITVSHIGVKQYTGDFAAYLAKLMPHATPAPQAA